MASFMAVAAGDKAFLEVPSMEKAFDFTQYKVIRCPVVLKREMARTLGARSIADDVAIDYPIHWTPDHSIRAVRYADGQIWVGTWDMGEKWLSYILIPLKKEVAK